MAQQPVVGQDLLVTTVAPHSVGLVWTSDRRDSWDLHLTTHSTQKRETFNDQLPEKGNGATLVFITRTSEKLGPDYLQWRKSLSQNWIIVLFAVAEWILFCGSCYSAISIQNM